MVTFEQLRISDDGQSLFIDAHVNKASCFDNVNLKSITICTEDQVSETDPLTYGDDFIYQEDISALPVEEKVYDKPQVLSENQLLGHMLENGGWSVNLDFPQGSVEPFISIVFSGKFSDFDTGYPPMLIVATEHFDPLNPSDDSNALFYATGEKYEEKGHETWRFKTDGIITSHLPPYHPVCFYLFKQETAGHYTYVRLNDTDDPNFLHFFYQGWYKLRGENKKEVHLVLNKNDFNENFTKGDLSHNMFFVYIECEGTPCPDTPCRLDEMTTLGVTFDYGIIFNQAMGFTRELGKDCDIPKNFIDFILNFDALKLAIETEHYVPAIGFWKWITQNRSFGHGGYLPKPCGCHG